MRIDNRSAAIGAALAAAVSIAAFAIYFAGSSGGVVRKDSASPAGNGHGNKDSTVKTPQRYSGDPLAAFSVELSP